jgi:hypothetical protein
MRELDMNAVRSRKVNYDALQLGSFGVAYAALNSVMERRHSSNRAEPQTPPNQTTVPVDPTFSGDSVVSKSSTDSKGEPFVQKFADRFVDSSLSSLQPYLEDLNWMDPTYRAFLGIQ